MPDSLFRVDNVVNLPSGEIADWSYWVLVQAASTNPISDATTFANTVLSTLAANTAFKALYPTTCSFAAPRISRVDIATGQILSTAVGSGTLVGTSGSGPLPPQIAVCVSLRTAFSGARFRGRFYLPSPVTSTLATTGRLATTNVATFATALSSAFAAALSGVPLSFLVIYSRVGRSTSPVLTLDVGDVFDTQRRRRDKLVEVRNSQAV
jgi:hypothetical protein